MPKERKLPKNAVKPLVEHCEKISGENGRPAAEVFKEYLGLMKKYAGYFFGEPWPEKLDKQFGFRDEDVEFIDGAEGYDEECERFTLVCLRRNMSMEGFDSEGFTENLEFYGRIECGNCSVWEATGLRKFVERVEQRRREIEEEVKRKEPSWVAQRMYEYMRMPDVVREDKMRLVELRLYEEDGGAKGKSCDVRNKYRCPYGEESERLIEDGGLVHVLWRLVEWYDDHWNPSHTFRPSAEDTKWYHYDEPSVIDVTSYEDVLKAVEDGRLERIMKERERYLKETRSEA